MTRGSLIERLSAHKTVGPAPGDEIAWLAAHGHLHRVGEGEVLTPKEGPVRGLHLVLDGHLAIHVDKGAGPKKVMEWYGGDVTGVLPYSRIVAPPGDVVAQEDSEVVTVDRADLDALIRECPQLAGILVHVMLDRARHFTSSFLHDEKLVSLGKLAAGLAHELNNPASAISRSSDDLSGQLRNLEVASRALGAAGLTDVERHRLEAFCDSVVGTPVQSLLSPLEQEAREESIRRWLKARHAGHEISDALAETPITAETLDAIAETVPAEKLDAALRWTAAAATVRRLNAGIREAARRISGLVGSVKEFTQMDMATHGEDVDLGRGLSNTLAVLGAKARQKSVAVRLDIDPDLPPVRGLAGELNQVWSNLIDNALDAVSDHGCVDVIARREAKSVVVRVADDGPGISSDVRDRIFDPFFTTKPVGQGTGLGLDIVRRLVQRHGGQIEVESSSAGAEFRVRLPIASSAGSGGNR